MTTVAGAKFQDVATLQEQVDDVELLERRLLEDPSDLVASEPAGVHLPKSLRLGKCRSRLGRPR